MSIDLQDLIAFFWTYSVSNKFRNEFDYSTWSHVWRISTNGHICDASWKLDNYGERFGKLHDLISFHPIPLLVSFYSRLAEIGVRITFVIMVSTAANIFEELDQQAQKLMIKYPSNSLGDEESSDNKRHFKQFDSWKSNYNLVTQFTEIINKCFGLVLLLAIAFDYSAAIIEIQNILLNKGMKIQYYLFFLHIILRLLLILIASHRVESKV